MILEKLENLEVNPLSSQIISYRSGNKARDEPCPLIEHIYYPLRHPREYLPRRRRVLAREIMNMEPATDGGRRRPCKVPCRIRFGL
jgi:hypothetical protein